MHDPEVIESRLNYLREYLGDLKELGILQKNLQDLKNFSRELLQYLHID